MRTSLALSLVLALGGAAWGAPLPTPEYGQPVVRDLEAAPVGIQQIVARVICAEDDNFNHAGSNVGIWTIDFGRGLISGSVIYDDYDPICTYDIDGTYRGASFEITLTETSMVCCESANVSGRVNRAQRRADGVIEWICGGVPTPGETTWVLCN